MNCNVLNAMKVGAVNTGVCGFCGNTVCRLHGTMHTEPLTSPREEACTTSHFMGIVVHQSMKADLF